MASEKKVRKEEWEKFGALAREVSALMGRMERMSERAETWRKALEWGGESGKVSETVEEEKDGDAMEGVEKMKRKIDSN